MTNSSAGERYLAGGMLYARAAGKVLLHLRDEGIKFNPGKWSVFGGRSDDADGGDPMVTWKREMQEELGVELPSDQIRKLGLFEDPDPTIPVTHLFYAEWPDADSEFVVTEGQEARWIGTDEARSLTNLSDVARSVIDKIVG